MSEIPYKPKTRSEITYFVNARQKTYKNSTEIYIPNDPYEKLEEGYESSEQKIKLYRETTTHEDENKERTQRRAFTALKDIVLCNVFELFVTFTFKTNRQDPDLCKAKMNGWLKRQRKLDK
jgi:hypothetical protein